MLLPIRLDTSIAPDGRVMNFGMAAMGQPSVEAPGLPQEPRIAPAIERKRRARAIHKGKRPYEMVWGPPVKYVEIPSGEAGTVETLKIMKDLVLGSWGHRNPEVAMLAQQIVSDLPSKDYKAEAQALFDFMREHVRYRLDPAGLEYVSTPWHTLLVSGNEDCDGHAVAIAALAMSLGHRAAFRTVKGDPNRPEQWSHVYGVIGITQNGQTEWLTADSTQKEAFLGWDPPEAKLFGMKTWVITPGLEEIEWDS